MRLAFPPLFALLTAACAASAPSERPAEPMAGPAAEPAPAGPKRPSQVVRIGPKEAREKAQAGEALLVCAYEGQGKCDDLALERSIPLAELIERSDALPKEAELIFYCACPNEKSAVALALRYARHGWWNVKVLDGGVVGWDEAGVPRQEKD